MITASINKLILLNGQRSGEVKAMCWDQIDNDLWIIPAELAKNGRMNRVPLSDKALELLELLRAGNADSEYVFPSRVGGAIPWLQKNTQRIRRAISKRLTEERGNLVIFHFTPHDLRRTVATKMSEMGIDDATIGRILNHSWVYDNVTTGVYVQDDRLPEKRQAIERWSARLEQILTGESPKVVKISQKNSY